MTFSMQIDCNARPCRALDADRGREPQEVNSSPPMTKSTKRAFAAFLILGTSLLLAGMTSAQQRGEPKRSAPLLTCDELKIVLESGNPVVALDIVEKYRRHSCSDQKTTYHCVECLEGERTVLYTLGVRYFGRPFLIDEKDYCKCFQTR